MAKLLLSWIAVKNDILRDEKDRFAGINTDGPNIQFHRHFYEAGKYDKHILLFSDRKQEQAAERIAIEIRSKFPGHLVEEKLLPLDNIIDLEEVKTKTETLLVQYSNDEIGIFFSPGTSIMQLSWYICHLTLGLKTQLFQTKAGKFSATGLPELLEIKVQQSETPVTAILKENSINNKGESGPAFLLTETIEPVYRRAYLVAQTDAVTTLIRGESGTGKENLARYIHENSARRNKPFIAVNCAALSDSLLESRLFGYKKGAFTGAEKDTPGLFSEANGGTIFLDEIGDISAQMQQALLRVLQEKEIQPIGGTGSKVDVRIIAATNAPLEKCCQEGKFRWDLYYRLCVAELELPTLLERGPQELNNLLDYFIETKRAVLHKTRKLQLSKEARQAILKYPFPGNIRELENLVESLYVFCSDKVSPADLPKRMQQLSPEQSLKLADAERVHILKVLHLLKSNQLQTAKTLDISLNTLKAKLEKYGLKKTSEAA